MLTAPPENPKAAAPASTWATAKRLRARELDASGRRDFDNGGLDHLADTFEYPGPSGTRLARPGFATSCPSRLRDVRSETTPRRFDGISRSRPRRRRDPSPDCAACRRRQNQPKTALEVGRQDQPKPALEVGARRYGTKRVKREEEEAEKRSGTAPRIATQPDEITLADVQHHIRSERKFESLLF